MLFSIFIGYLHFLFYILPSDVLIHLKFDSFFSYQSVGSPFLLEHLISITYLTSWESFDFDFGVFQDTKIYFNVANHTYVSFIDSGFSDLFKNSPLIPVFSFFPHLKL